MTYRSVIWGIILLLLLISCSPEVPDQIPPPPEGLTHVLAKGKVSLDWTEVEYAETYRVYRGTRVDGSFEVIGTVSKPPYEDNKVVVGNTYFYKVAGLNDEGTEGKLSAPHEVRYEQGKLDVPESLIHPGINLEDALTHYDLSLRNVGGLPLHWTLHSDDGWVSLPEPAEGDLEPLAETVVRISVQRQGVPGIYQGTVVVEADTDQTFQIPIQMTIAAVPRIAVTPLEISFQGVQQIHTLMIQNMGNGNVIWQIQNIPEWLEVDPTQGQTSNTAASTVQLSIKNPGQLQYDTIYPATIIVESNDATIPERTVSITLRTPPEPPRLQVASADKYLVFSISQSSREITVHNEGGGVMAWRTHISPAVLWLRVDPQQGGTEPNQPDPLTFTVDREQGLPGQRLKATVTIDAGAAGSEQIIIEVPIPEEKWTVSPESLTIEEEASESILIRNLGEGGLHWSVESNDFWIVLASKNDEIDPGKSYSLEVSVNLSSLTLGTHTGEVEIKTKSGKRESVRIQTTKMAHITGTTLDSLSGVALRETQISLDEGLSTSYPTGVFDIERAIPGPFLLQAERNGYLPGRYDGMIDDWGYTDPVELWLRPIPRVMRTIDDPSKPFHAPIDICFSDDGSRAYVADELGSVSIIDAFTDMMVEQNAEVGIRPMGIVAHPLGDEVYVADAEAHRVLILDAQSLKTLGFIETDKYPQQLAITQDGSRLYVTCRDTDSVVLVDTQRRQAEGHFPVGREPYGVALAPDERTLYVTNSGDSTVSILDALNGQRLGTVRVASMPQHLAVSWQYVFVSNAFGDRVSVIDQTSRQLVTHVEMGNAVLLSDLAVFEDLAGGDTIYVLNQTDSTLRLIDSITLKLIDAEIRIGDIPAALAIQPGAMKIYVANGGSANISVVGF